ncbi:hypothetical protein PSTT_03368 [Puccinia striiformis]|uniref:Uncharacterized protein n=2 Tax=Puccinia striiformis TaxID=27350 RepID=A0A2S4VWW7_9BASI|nr:hypothetical protein PSTT_03368 [Puccinia striiformis]
MNFCGLSLNSASAAQHPKPAGGAALANVHSQRMGSAGNGNNINRLCFPYWLPSPTNRPTARACMLSLSLNSTIKSTMEGSTRGDASKIYRMLQLHQLARKSRIYRRLLRRESKKDLPFHTKSKMIALQDLAEKGFAPQTPIHHPRIWRLRLQGQYDVLLNLGTPPVPHPEAQGQLRPPSIKFGLWACISSSFFAAFLACGLFLSIISQMILIFGYLNGDYS